MTQGCQCCSAGLGGHHPSLLLTASCLWSPGHSGLAPSWLFPSGLGAGRGSPGLCSFPGRWDPCCEHIPAGVKVATDPWHPHSQTDPEPGASLHRGNSHGQALSLQNTGERNPLLGLLLLPCLGASGDTGTGEKAASAFEGAARQYLLGEELQAAGSSAC